jgi:secretion/DNA translocation related CpaE-like protein
MPTPYADPLAVPPNGPARPAVIGPDEPAPPSETAGLLLSRDATLVEAVARLAAAVGSPVRTRAGRPTREEWQQAGVVLVGQDVAAELAGLLNRRPGVLLVGRQDPAGRGVDAATYQQAMALGAERVALLPHGQEWVVQALTQMVDGGRRSGVVGVVGGCGGAGSSVLAVAVAVGAARRQRRTLLADLDPLGGGIDLLVGAEQSPGLRWPELSRARGRVSGGMLREALPRVDDLSILSWDRGQPTTLPPEAAAAVATGAVRGYDLVVIDLPRAPDSVSTAWLRLVDIVVLVVPAAVRAVAAAGRVLAGIDALVPDVRLVVRGPASPTLPAELVAETVGLPLLAELRPEPGLRSALERAEAPGLRRRGPLARCAARVLAAVEQLDRAA